MIQLDEIERGVVLCLGNTPGEEELSELQRRLKELGFLVQVVENGKAFEPYLSTEVGRFVGVRSIRGFINGHERIFETVRRKAHELSL